jgi:hypothetical protein
MAGRLFAHISKEVRERPPSSANVPAREVKPSRVLAPGAPPQCRFVDAPAGRLPASQLRSTDVDQRPANAFTLPHGESIGKAGESLHFQLADALAAHIDKAMASRFPFDNLHDLIIAV